MKIFLKKLRHTPPNDAVLFCFVFVTGLCLRIPMLFLFDGYGMDPDAWRLIRSAQIISEGAYMVSRFPGYPLVELSYSLVWEYGPMLVNGLTALFSAVALAFFVLILKQYKSKHIIYASLAFFFTPVILINSFTSMDYLWALAFIMASIYFTRLGRPVIAGLVFGLAIGCRLTSGMMAIPLLTMYMAYHKKHFLNMILFSATAFIVSMVCYTPCIYTYGLSFLKFYKTARPAGDRILNKATVEIWGQIGFTAIIIAIIMSLANFNKRKHNESSGLSKYDLLIWSSPVLLYGLLFLYIPYEEAYLIPAIPSAIFLLNKYSASRIFKVTCVAIVLSCVVSFNACEGFQGPFIIDYIHRKQTTNLLYKLAGSIETLPPKSAVVLGEMMPVFQVILFKKLSINPRETKLEYLLSMHKLMRLKNKGYGIYYIPSARKSNLIMHRFDLKVYGAYNLLLLPCQNR